MSTAAEYNKAGKHLFQEARQETDLDKKIEKFNLSLGILKAETILIHTTEDEKEFATAFSAIYFATGKALRAKAEQEIDTTQKIAHLGSAISKFTEALDACNNTEQVQECIHKYIARTHHDIGATLTEMAASKRDIADKMPLLHLALSEHVMAKQLAPKDLLHIISLRNLTGYIKGLFSLDTHLQTIEEEAEVTGDSRDVYSGVEL